MKITTHRRDPNQSKSHIEDSGNPFTTPVTIITADGVDIMSEQSGSRGVEIRISMSHSDIFQILLEMADNHPDIAMKITLGVSGYLQHKESLQKFEDN